MKNFRKVLLSMIFGAVIFGGCSMEKGEESWEAVAGEDIYTPFLAESVSIRLPEWERSSGSWINGYILAGDRLLFNMYQTDLLGYDGGSLQFYQKSFQLPLCDLYAEEPWYQNHGIHVPEEVMEELVMPEELYYSKDGEAEFVHRFVEGQDGHIYYLSAKQLEKEEYLWTVYKCVADTGECVDKWSLKDIPDTALVEMISENTLHEHSMQVDEADTLYLVDGKEPLMYVIPRSGAIETTIKLPECITAHYVWNLEGRLEFVALDESGVGKVYYLDAGTLKWSEVTGVSEENVQAITADEQGRVCYYTGTELFFLNGEGEKEPFIRYEKSIVKPEDLLCFEIIDNSVIYLDDCRKLIKHTKSEEHAGAEKEILTLGYAGMLDSEWNQYLMGFNKSSLYYEVQLKEYDVDNGHERLLADLSSGRGPDLFFTDVALVREFVKNDLIEDLTPYLQDGKGLEREHFVESVLYANTYEEVLYTIPQNFAIDLLLGMEKNFTEINPMEWTISDYMGIVKNCGGMEILGGKYIADTQEWARLLIAMPALEGNLDYYADEEQGVARFEEAEFVQLLQMAQSYEYKNFGNNGMETKKKLLEGDLLLENWMITNVGTYLENRAVLGNEEIYLSYPVVDGNGGYGIQNYGSLSISAGSEKKEAAWQFMEYVLNARGSRQSITGEYFASKQKTFDYQLKCATIKQYQYDKNGIGYLADKNGNPIEKPRYSGESFGVAYEVYAATEEELQLLRELVDGISYSGDLQNDVVYGIVMEEIGSLVTGVNDVDGAVHNLQTRVGLYLEERK